MDKQTLFHWTAPATKWLGKILADGEIEVKESNVSLDVPQAGPDVVWLTTSEDLDGASWMGECALKQYARLRVELPPGRAMPWAEWAKAQERSTEAHREALAESGGDPETWWVTKRPVRRGDITQLVMRPFERIPPYHELLGTPDHYEGRDLLNLFQSAGARRALDLVDLPKRRVKLATD